MKQTTSGDNNLADSVNHALNMRANIRRAFWMYFVLFALLVGNIAFFVTVQAPGLMHNPFNPRTRGETDALRGDILDSRGRVLAYSGVGAERAYPFGRDFVHIVGFDGFGRSGAEARHNLTLNAISGEIVQRVRNLAQGEPLRGNRLVLTVDADLQRLVVDQLGHSRGAVVVMEPSTGKLLAMASYPDFDPNDLAAEWNTLITDNANAPLLNRAAQGLYPPGSVFKIVTASAVYRYLDDFESFTHDCRGEIFFDGVRLQCFNATAHGVVDLGRAFALSCNTFFAAAAMEIGPERLREASERAGFNASTEFELVSVPSSFVMDAGAETGEIMQTAIGQGRTLATPLHMAMITSAVANGGIKMRPYVADHALTSFGRQTGKTMPSSMGRVFEIREAAKLTDIMVQAVEDGSARPVFIDGTAVAAKTGTAQNPAGNDHGWFVAFAPAENPRVAVAVVLEHSGGPSRAMQVTRSIIGHVLEN